MKHAHMLMAALTLLCFAYSSYCVFTAQNAQRAFGIASHIVYALAIASGAYTLHALTSVADAQTWIYPKIALLAVAVAAIVVARKRPAFAKGGVALSWAALLGAVLLAAYKPALW